MLPSELPPTTSASQLMTYARCPRAYFFRYVLRLPAERRPLGMALGSAVHSTLAWWFEERAQERTPLAQRLDEVLEADLAAATAYACMEGQLSDGGVQLLGEGRRLVAVFLAEHAELPVLETEVRFDMLIEDPDTGEVMPRPLVGYFDAELARPSVLELKTARRAYGEPEVRTNLQFAAYRTIAARMGLDIEVVALIRTKVPRVQNLVLRADAEVSRWFMRAAVQIERAIQAGHFPPAPGVACASCEYNQACLRRGVEAGAHTPRRSVDNVTS